MVGFVVVCPILQYGHVTALPVASCHGQSGVPVVIEGAECCT